MSEPKTNQAVSKRIAEAIEALKQLGLARAQQNERSGLTLLALLNLKPSAKWAESQSPLIGITPMMDFMAGSYGKQYAPNTRETIRRQSVHQFLQAGLIVINPDDPDRPTNSPKAVYQIEQLALAALRMFGTKAWPAARDDYLARVGFLTEKHSQIRTLSRIPLLLPTGKTLTLSPGGQNVLIAQIIEEFAPRFAPGGIPLYLGDAEEKFGYYDEAAMQSLGVKVDPHGKMPDVVIHDVSHGWLLLVEAVTSHGPIDIKRKVELQELFSQSTIPLIFVTAFLTQRALLTYMRQLAWETQVWIAESPDHVIHFDGEHYFAPYELPKA